MRTLATAAAIVLCLAVSACAGTPQRNGVSRNGGDDDIDLVKVIGVNQWAERRHATVMWVNYPKKPLEPKNNDG
jgi:hypothetical protein